LTQGAYGTPGGNICLPDGTTVNQAQIMIDALTAEPGNMKVFGRQDLNRYWVIRLTDVNQGPNSNIFKMLPGGGPSKVFGLDSYPGVPEYSNTPTWPVAPLQPNGPSAGKIRNILFAQTLTLYFNTTIDGSSLATLPLNGTVILTDRNCGSLDPVGEPDSIDFTTYAAISYISNPANGYPATVAGLLQLANDMLGGVTIPGLTLTEVADAVAAINEAFDECKLWVGFIPAGSARLYVVNNDHKKNPVVATEEAAAKDLRVTSYPNPYNDNVRFVIESDVSGEATLEVYNMLGQKVETVYKGIILAGKGHTINYTVPVSNRTNLIYILRIGGKQVTGKLIRIG
jgi:hypothetical protein